MPVRLTPPLDKEFVLEETDRKFGKPDEEPTRIRVKQALEGENMQRQNLWREYKRTFEAGGEISVTQSISPAEVKRKEVFLTLTFCNLMDEQGNPVFQFPLKENEFNKAWAMLPPLVANEIHTKVLEVNLLWSAEGESN